VPELQQELGEATGIAYSLYNLGDVARKEGDFVAAGATLPRAQPGPVPGDRPLLAHLLEAWADLARCG
jgi:hypothetical protein